MLSLEPAIRMSLAIWLVRVANSSRSRRAAAGSLSSTRWNRLRATRITEEFSSAVAVDGRCIAIVGGSRGAELALLLASHYPDIKAVVAIVPGSAVFPALTDAMTTPGFSFGNQSLPFVPMTWGATPDLLVGNLRGAFEAIMRDEAAMQRAAIAVEKINGPVQFVSASRDEMWPSKEMADAMMQRLMANGFRHASEHLVVQGGHGEPLDEFPKMEAFLDTHFKQACR